ncbi:MAG TPA: ABC transporter permease [Candidatus Aminicenantes bacterium]|nr:ABC transporter permease [Candidatus Aminicenantes bacterium]HDT12721.1 ABC transporter permease [Candidatus Aminicenantes bacterium]
MKAVLSILRKEFLQLRRDRRMFPVIFISPVLQLLLLGYAANLDVKSIPSVVCDLDRSAASRSLVDDFVQSGYFTVRARVGEMAGIDRYLDHGDASMAIVVPRGFGGDVAARRQAGIMLIADGSESQSAMIGVNYGSMVAARATQKLVLEAFERGAGPGSRPVLINPEVRVWYNPALKSRNFMVPGVLGLILMIMTMVLAALGIVREREAGTMEQLIVTPIRPHQLILGKLLPFVIIGLVDATFVLAVARGWFGIPIRGSVPLLYVLSVVFMLNTLGIGLFISTISRTQQQAMLTAMFFILPQIILSGFVFPIENMPEFFQAVSLAIPIRYFFTIIRGIMLKGAGLAELWPQAAALTGLGVLILTLSVARFRKKLD